MKFSYVAHMFENIAQESSRTEITKKLADLLSSCSSEEIQILAYISMGSLYPPYKNIQFGMSDKTLLVTISTLLSRIQQEMEHEYDVVGDLGLVVQNIWQGDDYGMTITEVYNALKECAEISGHGSVEKKQQALVSIFQKMDAVSIKYSIRIMLGTLRLGFSDMTFIDALSWMAVGSKAIRSDIEHAYNICADLGLVAYTLHKEGIQGIKQMSIHIGIPIRPAAAERAINTGAIIERLGSVIAQPKLDGFRVQVHIQAQADGTKRVYFFSRNLLDMSDMFPELVHAFQDLPVQNFICEGEAIAYDEDTGSFLSFQETVKRKRKHDISSVSKSIPLRLYIFDALYLNNVSLLELSHTQRRTYLEGVFKSYDDERLQVISERSIATFEELEEYFLSMIESGLEGIIAKRPEAVYQPGKRNFNWIKLKRTARGVLVDTVDVVVLGYYYGKGKRTQFGIGAFLVGIYNDKTDAFESIAKIGTGLEDEEWKALKKSCDRLKVEEKPKNYYVLSALYPDVWVSPHIVCTVQADEITISPLHTAGKDDKKTGYALRFPRFIMYRDDKSSKESTTSDEIRHLYMLQHQDVKQN